MKPVTLSIRNQLTWLVRGHSSATFDLRGQLRHLLTYYFDFRQVHLQRADDILWNIL